MSWLTNYPDGTGLEAELRRRGVAATYVLRTEHRDGSTTFGEKRGVPASTEARPAQINLVRDWLAYARVSDQTDIQTTSDTGEGQADVTYAWINQRKYNFLDSEIGEIVVAETIRAHYGDGIDFIYEFAFRVSQQVGGREWLDAMLDGPDGFDIRLTAGLLDGARGYNITEPPEAQRTKLVVAQRVEAHHQFFSQPRLTLAPQFDRDLQRLLKAERDKAAAADREAEATRAALRAEAEAESARVRAAKAAETAKLNDTYDDLVDEQVAAVMKVLQAELAEYLGEQGAADSTLAGHMQVLQQLLTTSLHARTAYSDGFKFENFRTILLHSSHQSTDIPPEQMLAVRNTAVQMKQMRSNISSGWGNGSGFRNPFELVVANTPAAMAVLLDTIVRLTPIAVVISNEPQIGSHNIDFYTASGRVRLVIPRPGDLDERIDKLIPVLRCQKGNKETVLAFHAEPEAIILSLMKDPPIIEQATVDSVLALATERCDAGREPLHL